MSAAALTERTLTHYLKHEIVAPAGAIRELGRLLFEEAKGGGPEEFLVDAEMMFDSAKKLAELVATGLTPAKLEAVLSGGSADLLFEIRTLLSQVDGYCTLLLGRARASGMFVRPLLLMLDVVHKHCAEINSSVVRLEQFNKVEDSGKFPVISAIPPVVHRGRLLVVDGEQGSRDTLVRRLKRQGHTVTVAGDGAKAFEVLETADVDVILLDQKLPDMNGSDLLRRLKRDDRLRQVAVIMVSGLDERQSAIACIQLGAEDYLCKPVDQVLLMARIGACLERRRLKDREFELNKNLQQANQELRAARRDAAFSEQAVLTRYPAPVAIPYRRFCRQTDPPTRLKMLFTVLEACVRYLVTLGVSDLLHCLTLKDRKFQSLPDHSAFDFLRRETKMSLGMWTAALRETARLLAGFPERMLVELPILCEPGGVLDAGPLDWLVRSRNESAHEEGLISRSPEECRALIGEARPRLEEVLQRAAFICDFPLGFSQPGLAKDTSPGSHRYYLHPCMGARVANTADAYVVEVPAPLQVQIPFVIAPDGGRLLYLWPLLVQRVPPVTGRHTLYVFESIPDRRRPYLSEIHSGAIDVRDDWRQILHDAPAGNHNWLFDRLSKMPAAHPLPVELNLSNKLQNLAGGRLTGRQLGSNVLLEAIARGGFSTIYAARTVSGQRVAVKVIEVVDARGHFFRFRQEFEKLQSLQHPGIIRCFESGNSLIDGKEIPWYSMEFAVGGDLSDRIEERKTPADLLPWNDLSCRPQILGEFRTVVEAVSFLHRAGIVHRDIKPSNVLIVDNGELRLSDFGLVKNLTESMSEAPRTSTGAVLGTLSYMAPEQEKGEETQEPADVYALGILLAELATGRKLYPDSKVPAGSTLHRQQSLAQLPRTLRKLILRCTDAHPAKRFADGQAVLFTFTQLQDELLAEAFHAEACAK